MGKRTTGLLGLLMGLVLSAGGCSTTLLVYETEKGDIGRVESLLDDGVDVNATELGRTALMYAAQHGHIDIVKLLLERGADVNHQHKGITALLLAAEGGYPDVIRVLLKAGADPDIRMQQFGSYPIHQACFRGHIAAAMVLLDIDDRYFDVRNKSQHTPLHVATMYRHTALAMRLVERGANVNAWDQLGNTPLHYACQFWNPQLIEIFVKNGADPDIANVSSETALHFAAHYAPCGGSKGDRLPGNPHEVHRRSPSSNDGGVQRGAAQEVHRGPAPDRKPVTPGPAPGREVVYRDALENWDYDHAQDLFEASAYFAARILFTKAGGDVMVYDSHDRTPDEIYQSRLQAEHYSVNTEQWGGLNPMLRLLLEVSMQQFIGNIGYY